MGGGKLPTPLVRWLRRPSTHTASAHWRYSPPLAPPQASYAYQHIYLPLAYGLLAINVRTQDITDLWIK